MRFVRPNILIIISLLISLRLAAKTVNAEISTLWHKYTLTKGPSKRIDILIKLGAQYIYLNQTPNRDSVFDIAVQSALLNDTLLFNTYDNYFKVEDFQQNLSAGKARTFATNMLSIARTPNNNEWLYMAYAAMAKANLLAGNNDVANDNINKAYYHVSQLHNDKLKVKCMLLMGYLKELSSKKIEAFRNYSDALYLSEQMANDSLKNDCYQKLSDFYYGLKKYDKATSYKKKQFQITLSQKPVDSNKITDLNLNLADILYHNNEILQAEKVTQTIIQYCRISGYEQAKIQAFFLYRSYLVDNSLFAELRDLYEKQYPEEYKEMAVTNPALYCRLNAYILEANGKPDSAQVFYQMAEDMLLKRNRGPIPHANFYKRYGEFLLRQNNITAAIQKFDSSYKYALAAKYFPYLIDVSHYLDSLNYLQKNVDKAYQFALLNKNYTSQQALVNKGEEMLQLEVENEARQQELKAEMDRKETERHHNIQYTFMVVAIIGVFILLTILGSFKVHPGMIRALGFFSFIFFFEFVIMLADHRIHDFTHGEPWKFMAFKIVLIAMLLPLHHWLEEKVIHYLVHHRLLDTSNVLFKLPSFKKKAKPVAVEEKHSEN